MGAENISITVTIMQYYNSVTLSVDIMKVEGISFPMTVSRHIKFRSAGKMDSMKISHILKYVKALIDAYITGGFKVTIMLTEK